MKKIIASLSLFLFAVLGFAQGQEELSKVVGQIATELEAKHPGLSKIKVAILEFRTTDNKLTKFNQYMQEELLLAYKNSQRFEIIDQNAVNDLIQSFGWKAEKARSFEYNESFSMYMFEQIGIVPNALIYGTIADNDETITLTAYIVPNSVKSTNLMSVQKFSSSEFTDKLLEKPIRERKPAKPQVVVVEKEVVVEKPVIVEKVVERPKETPKQEFQILKSTLGNYQFEITSVALMGNKIVITMIIKNDNEDGYIYGMDGRFFDTEGNEFTSSYSHNTFRDRKLLKTIPLKGTITFHDGPAKKIKEIAALEINVYQSYGNILGTLLFHNIPVTQ